MSEQISSLEFLVSQGFSETILHRFWRNVAKGCWNWTGKKQHKGYGVLCKGGSSAEQPTAHRISWMIHKGAIPDGMCVLHKCDNPACVNPEHLFLGTMKDNSQDMAKKGRNRGNAKLTEDEVIEIRKLKGLVLQKELAVTYGVNRSAICNIMNGKKWKHVATVTPSIG